MFCPNCGKLLEDGTVFCGGCGFKLPVNEAESGATEVQQDVIFVEKTENAAFSDNQPAQQAPQQPVQHPVQKMPQKPVQQPVQQPIQQVPQQPVQQAPQKATHNKANKPKKKKKKAGIIIALLLVFLLIGTLVLGAVGLLVGSFFFTPEAAAKDFASKLSQQDTGKMYDMMFADDGYVTYEQFEEKYNNDGDFLYNYAGNPDYTVDKLGETAFEINFSGDISLYVEVVKAKDGFLYFDEYQIKTADCVGFDLYIPDGATATVNGVAVSIDGATYDGVTELYNYYIYPILTGDNEIVVTDVNGNVYEKRVEAYDTSYFNTLTLDAKDLEKGNVIKDDYTAADAESFFNDMMNEYIFNSYTAVYCESPNNILSKGLESFMVNDYRLYAENGYSANLQCVTEDAKEVITAADIMTEEEFNSLSWNETGWAVYKISEIQKKLDNLWGSGIVSANSFCGENDIITSKGFLLRCAEDGVAGNYDYYGKVKSSKFDAATNTVVIQAYVLKCDTVNKKIYDEATGLQITTAQIKRGTGVNFDAIVKQLGINTAGLSTVEFTFQLSNKGVSLVHAFYNAVSDDILQAQNVVLQDYERSFYMKVKAAGGLNMRYEPTEKSQVLKLIPDASAVEVRGYAESITDWVYVYWGGYEGWVNYKYLIPAEYTTQPSGEVYWYSVKAEGGLNMRAADNQNAKLVKLIPDGSYVKFICCNPDNTWAYVIYNDVYAGWVNTKYINFSHSTDS